MNSIFTGEKQEWFEYPTAGIVDEGGSHYFIYNAYANATGKRPYQFILDLKVCFIIIIITVLLYIVYTRGFQLFFGKCH